MKNSRIVITVLSYETMEFISPQEYTVEFPLGAKIKLTGCHRVLLAGACSQTLKEYGVMVTDVDQCEEKDCFAMIIWGDMGDNLVNLDSLRHKLLSSGKELGASIKVQREDLFKFMHTI